jgi:DNA-binding LacI/PurR family transcriptional regulator
MAITIREVAQKAGVGVATVSRVLNNSGLVSETTRQAVQAAIDDLNYVPNPTARRLSLGKTFTIAVIVPFMTRPSFVERLRGVSDVMENCDYEFTVYNIEGEQRRKALFSDLPRADGLIVMSMTLSQSDVNALKRSELPVVLIDSDHPEFISIVEDSHEGARKATQYLIDLGHKRIGFIGGPLSDFMNFENTSTNRRLKGFKQTLQSAQIEIDNDLIAIDNKNYIDEKSVKSAREFIKTMLRLDHPPTAIFASADMLAMGALQGAREIGIRVPEDLSIVGYDDIEIAEYLDLTTINQQLQESGRQGAELILKAITSGVYQPIQEQLPTNLVKRKTAQHRPASNP